MTITILASGQSNLNNHASTILFEPSNNVSIWNQTQNISTLDGLGNAYRSLTSSDNYISVNFACRLAELTGEDIRVFNIGFSGNAIAKWINSSGVRQINYNRIEAVLNAAGIDNVDIFLWHQGEADDYAESVANLYRAKWNRLIMALTNDGYIHSSTPVIAGELAARTTHRWMNPILKNIASDDLRMGLAKMAQLETTDGVHFRHESLREAGRRRYIYALSSTNTIYKGVANIG